jgi:enamine deaminase RidA (YjgF/YER057c/UK114 family)
MKRLPLACVTVLSALLPCPGFAQQPAAANTAAPTAKLTAVPYPNLLAPISLAVSVPAGADLLFLSGSVGDVTDATAPKGTREAYGDTKTQALGALKNIQKLLAAQDLTMANVVMMHAYLAGDPKMEGKADFVGWNEAYKQFFGTPEQPAKPARSSFEVAALAGPGLLIEVEVIAVRTH